ncbi:E1A-binding protein p400-like [Gastrophryne carolinensis]
MHHGNVPPNTSRQLQRSRSFTGNEGEETSLQTSLPQSPAPASSFAPAVSSPGPQSPSYQIQQLIMSRNPVAGQNVNITLQNVGPVVAGNQQITLTPLPIPNPNSPGYQFSPQPRRFEHGSPSYIQVTSPMSQQVQTQSPTQPNAVPIQALQGVRAATAGASLGMCSQSPTRGFVDASVLVRQISLSPSNGGHFVFQEGSGIAQIAQGATAQVQLPSGAAQATIRERRLSQPHSQTGGTIHHLGPQSPLASGANMQTLSTPSHITTTNLPPQISSIIQGQLIQQQQVLHGQQLGRAISFDRTSGGMIAGVAAASSFSLTSSPTPTSPSRVTGPQTLSSLPLTPTVSTVKKQSKKLEEIPPASAEDAQMRKQCLEHHHKHMKNLKEHFKEYLIELFFLQHFQGNMMDFLAFKKKPSLGLQGYLRQNDLDLEEEEDEEQSEVINDEVKIVTGKDGQTGTPVAIATQLPPNVSAAFSSQQQPFQQSLSGSGAVGAASAIDIEAFKRQQALTQADPSKRPRLDVRHGMVFQHPGVASGVPLQQLMPTAQGGMPPTPQTVQLTGQKQSQQQYDPSKGPPVQNAASLHTPPPQLPGRVPASNIPISSLPTALHLAQQQPIAEGQIQPQIQVQVKTQSAGVPVQTLPQSQMPAQISQSLQATFHAQMPLAVTQAQGTLQQQTVTLMRPATESPQQKLTNNTQPTSFVAPAAISTSSPVASFSLPATRNNQTTNKAASTTSPRGAAAIKIQTGAQSGVTSENAQDKTVEQENLVHQRIAELRKEGLWSLRRLPKVQEPSRVKSHWDYLLEEMQWMAADFAQERMWKIASAKKLVRTVARRHEEKRMNMERAKAEEENKLKHIAALIAREIEYFWSNIEQVVEIKLQMEFQEKRRKALNLNVDSMKGPLKAIEEACVKHKHGDIKTSSSWRKRKASSSWSDVDDEEETIAEQETKEGSVDHKAELNELKREADMPLDDLVKEYEGAYDENFHWPHVFIHSEEGRKAGQNLKDSAGELDMPQKCTVLIDSLLAADPYRLAEKSSPGILTCRKHTREIGDVARAAELLLPSGSARVACAMKPRLSPLLHGTLREYQLVGLEWLEKQYKKNLNGILADEAGLGKNVQVIALMAHLASCEGNWGPHLIVVRSCKLLRWELEFKRWCPGLKLLLYFGKQRELRKKRQRWEEPNHFHVCITSYKQLFKGLQAFMKIRWKYLVLDEIHQIRNMNEKHWDAIFNFPSQNRLLLRDTPLQNTWKDHWTMVHFLIHGISKPYLDFPLKTNGEESQENCHKLFIMLHRTVRPFVLRRSKKEVEKQLPKKYEHVLKCRLSNRQRSLYEDVILQPGTQDSLKGGHFVSVLHVLMQLQRICNHPDLVDLRSGNSSYACQAVQYETASLALQALEYDPWRNCDLSLFDLLGLENNMTRYEAHILPVQKVTQRLMEEIYSNPDTTPRPNPVKIKPNRLFQPVPYGQKPEGRTVAISNNSASRLVTTTTATVTQQGQSRGRSPVTTASANLGGDVKIAQLAASGAVQGRIAQPKTPVTLQFQGNTFTLSQSQLRQLTAGQPLQLQGSVLQIVSAPGQQYIRPPGPVVMQTVSQGNSIQNAINSLGNQHPSSIPNPTMNPQSGFNIPEKRSKVLYDLHKQKVSILMLQETHFQEGRVPVLNGRYFPSWFHSPNPSGRSRCASIANHKSVPFTEIERLVDPEGRFIFVKVLIHHRKYTLANLYLPNHDQVVAFQRYSKKLEDFMEGVVILGGDFNLALNPSLDTYSGRFSVSLSKLQSLRRTLHDLQLMDVWRLENGSARDYTYYSPVHRSYSRIDYILLSHHALQWHPKASIGPFLCSDHAPVFVSLDLPGAAPRQWSWRLNDNLLRNMVCLGRIQEAIANFAADHAQDDCSPTIQWEALKCVFRGIFIQEGSRLKREMSALITKTLQTIELEIKHKTAPSPELLSKLSLNRNKLLKIYDQIYLRYRDRMHASMGESIVDPAKIPEVFRDFYSGLYNLQLTMAPKAELDLGIQDYVVETPLPVISEDSSAELEIPFTELEVLRAIKEAPAGKSPCPDGFPPRFYKTLVDCLTPFLVKAFNHVEGSNPLPKQALEATIAVIPKPDKNRVQGRTIIPYPITDLSSSLKTTNNLLPPTQDLAEERQRIIREKLERLFSCNERRCGLSPVYGADLLNLCSVRTCDVQPSVEETQWGWAGSINCLISSYSNKDCSDHLRHLILSTEKQKEMLEPLIKSTLTMVPAVVAPPPQIRVPHPPPSYTHNMKILRCCLREKVHPCFQDLQEKTSPNYMQSRDVRLIQCDSGKLEALSILLHKLRKEGRRVLIFSQMLLMLDILETFLDFHHLIFLRIDEFATYEQCHDLMKRFNQDHSIFCILMSTQSRSLGVPYVEADTVIFYDSDLNPVMGCRAQAWCDRIGKAKDIHIYRLVSGNSVEEKLLKNGTKDLIREVAAQGNDFSMAFLTQQTIHELFELYSPLEDSGFGVKAEEFVMLSQDPPAAETIATKFAKPFIEALKSIERGGELDMEISEPESKGGQEMAVSASDGLCYNEETTELTELAAVVDQLTPIEKYALNYLEEFYTSGTAEKPEEHTMTKTQWEVQQLKKNKEWEDNMAWEESGEELLTYTREDAYNKEFIYDNPDGQTEVMPIWTPPTPPQDENDIYIDSVMCLMYDSNPIPESKLPPVYVRKEHKRHKADPAASGRKKKQRHGESVVPPRSLFDRATPAMLKVKREGKEQKKNILLKQQAQFAKPLPTLVKPTGESGPENPEWLISEDWALLQAVKHLLELPLNLTVVSPAHTPNWDLVSDVVNSCSRIYRSSKQCRSRYENVIIPREEGKIMFEANPKKKTKSIYKTKNSRPLRTSQIYAQDEGGTHTQLYNNRFELMKMTAGKRSPPIKPLLGMNPFQKNPKHASVLSESGISYDKPLPPIQVASLRAERIAKEKKALVEQHHRAQQQAGPQASQQPLQNGQQPSTPTVQPAQAQPQQQVVQPQVVQQPQAVPTTAVLAGNIKTAVTGANIQAAAVGGNVIVNTVAGVPSATFQPINKRLASPVIPGTLTAPGGTPQVVHTQQRAIATPAAPAEMVTIATNQGVRAVTPVTGGVVVCSSITPVQTQARSVVTQVTTASTAGVQLTSKAITPAQFQLLRQQQAAQVQVPQIQAQAQSPAQIKAVGKLSQEQLLKLQKQKMQIPQQTTQTVPQQQQQQQQPQQPQQGGPQAATIQSQQQPQQAQQQAQQIAAVAAPRGGAVLTGPSITNLPVARLLQAQGQIQAQPGQTAQVALAKPPVVSAVVSSTGVTTLPVTVAGISVAIGQPQKAAGGQTVVAQPLNVQQLLKLKQQQQQQQKALQSGAAPVQTSVQQQKQIAGQQVTVQAQQQQQAQQAQQQKLTYTTQPAIKTQFLTTPITQAQKSPGAQQVQAQIQVAKLSQVVQQQAAVANIQQLAPVSQPVQPQTVTLTPATGQQQVHALPAGAAAAQVVQQKLLQQQQQVVATAPQLQTPSNQSSAPVPGTSEGQNQQAKLQVRASTVRIKAPTKPS